MLITGATGFLGTEVARTCVEAGLRVLGIGHGAGPQDVALQTWVEADVDFDSVAELIRREGAPDLVIHAAGGSSVKVAHDAPLSDFRRTVGGTAGLIEALRLHAPSARMVMVSSAAVYGNGHSGPIREDAVLDPISYYGAHKRMAEELCLAANRHWQLDVTIVRFFSLYGAGLRKQIFWDLAEKCRFAPEHIDLGGTGEETRDFLHVSDAALLLRHLASAEASSSPLIVNGGTGTATPIRYAAEELARACGSPVRTRFDGHQRPGDPTHLVADATRLMGCGFRPSVTLDKGLAGFASWHRQQTGANEMALKSAGAVR